MTSAWWHLGGILECSFKVPLHVYYDSSYTKPVVADASNCSKTLYTELSLNISMTGTHIMVQIVYRVTQFGNTNLAKLWASSHQPAFEHIPILRPKGHPNRRYDS